MTLPIKIEREKKEGIFGDGIYKNTLPRAPKKGSKKREKIVHEKWLPLSENITFRVWEKRQAYTVKSEICFHVLQSRPLLSQTA
ncbi:hypothetical protein HQ43_07100 [Porphyromonas canoris]|uniref:Uncharacterized protein n=1 Tax=Porphyromonas canoris TaxID=36875 RepID=A0ABR4XKB3_9PORP|nr:hypothetical protein HQ43_07100 [Porphyromonas canoris]